MIALFDNDLEVYLEPPTIPAGMTIREYGRTRAARVPPGVVGAIARILSSR
jgi:hypothetical protein